MLLPGDQINLLILSIFNQVSDYLQQVLTQCVRFTFRRFVSFLISRYWILKLLEVKADKVVVNFVVRVFDVLQATWDHIETPGDDLPQIRTELWVIVVHDQAYKFIDVIWNGIDLAPLAVSSYISCEP